MRSRRTMPACVYLALVITGCDGSSRNSSPAVQTESAGRLVSSAPRASDLTQYVVTSSGVPLVVGAVVPLTAALSNGQLQRVRTLLEEGADPNVREERPTSWPPLAFARRGNGGLEPSSESEYLQRQEMVNLLLKHGADPNIRWCNQEDQPACNERNGVTPLMWAAILGDEEFAAALLTHGADPSLRDWRGLTAADYRGVKSAVPSLCLPRRAAAPVVRAAAELVKGELFRGHPPIEDALRMAAVRSVEVVTDQRICEAAAVAHARYRPLDGIWRTEPRWVVPVVVVRGGPVWLVDDEPEAESFTAVAAFDSSWRLLGWGESGS